MGPDANEINAAQYLSNIFNSKKTSSNRKNTIVEGEKLVNKVSSELFFLKFTELTSEQKEKTLRKVEETNLGERFLSLLIDTMFEAMLADPVYGAQPNFAGWRWLEHIPGFPRPKNLVP